MPDYQRISDLLGVTDEDLHGVGAFNSYTSIDAELYVDPALLKRSSHPEMRDGHQRLQERFVDVMHLIDVGAQPGDKLWAKAVHLLSFPEEPAVTLGFAKDGSPGAGIGPILADQILRTACQIVKAGKANPRIFELVGLFENDIGADRLSDMAIHGCYGNFLRYTERVSKSLDIEVEEFEYGGSTFFLPERAGRSDHIVLIPIDVLRDLPTALDWNTIDLVAKENDQLRDRVNQDIGDSWKQASNERKDVLKRVMLRNPDLFDDVLAQYQSKKSHPYDFKNDPKLFFKWETIANECVSQSPLVDLPSAVSTVDEVVEVVESIVYKFKSLVEDNGLWKLLKNQKEKVAQLLFFGIANAYCESFGIDLSPETDSGRGPVDFKFSQGFEAKVLVEIKLTSSSRVTHGYEVQLEEYVLAEKAKRSIYVVIQNTNTETQIEAIDNLYKARVGTGKYAPPIVVIDAREKDSASKFKKK